jgi:hypothetical protein
VDDGQTRNTIKVADVAGTNRVAQFQGASPDNEVGQREIDPFRSLPGAYPGNDLRSGLSDGMNGYVRHQLIEKLAALPGSFRRLSPIDAVSEFRHRQRADHDGDIADGFADCPDYLGSGHPAALGGDQDTGVDN